MSFHGRYSKKIPGYPSLHESYKNIFVPGNGGGNVVATVSIGIYKVNPAVGGDFRIGVTKAAQGKGYGRLCILFAFSQLAAMGIKYGESAISFKRKESLNLHYALGFRPQTNLKYVANQTTDKKIKNWNFILKIRLKWSYWEYLRKQRQKFITK